MVKHALNAFLAPVVTFTNEIASICESVGADASEVERGVADRAAHRQKGLCQGRARRSPAARWRATCSFSSSIAEHARVQTPLIGASSPSNACASAVVASACAGELGDAHGQDDRGTRPDLQARHRCHPPIVCDRARARASGRRRERSRPTIRRCATLPERTCIALVTLAEDARDAMPTPRRSCVATEWPEFRDIERR